MTTRRMFLAGAAALIATPALVKASSLDYVPRLTYTIYDHPTCSLLDVVRSDGKLVGWIPPWEIKLNSLRTTQEIVALATQGITPLTQMQAAVEFVVYNNGSTPMTTEEVIRVYGI